MSTLLPSSTLLGQVNEAQGIPSTFQNVANVFEKLGSLNQYNPLNPFAPITNSVTAKGNPGLFERVATGIVAIGLILVGTLFLRPVRTTVVEAGKTAAKVAAA